MNDKLLNDFESQDKDHLLIEKQIRRRKLNLLLLIGFYLLLAVVSFVVI